MQKTSEANKTDKDKAKTRNKPKTGNHENQKGGKLTTLEKTTWQGTTETEIYIHSKSCLMKNRCG